MPKSKRDDRPHVCVECLQTFRRNHDLERHWLAKHASEEEKASRSWYCLCGLSGIQWTNIASHIRTHTGEKIRCKECSFEATSNANMTRHRQGKLPDYPCSSRKKTKAKNSRPASPSPTDDDTASSSSFSGIVPLTAEEYAQFLSLIRSAREEVPLAPSSQPTSPGLGNPYPVVPRLPTPSPPPEAFLPIPEEYRLPPLINVNHYDLVAASAPSTSHSRRCAPQ
ncbi:uncharacterized protein EV420DRAFT_790129 [Desarmillaria tabescens]|uniref:C2H2-type domain-containing protein n=1 Tax=Armillaria tabescens TaxID=1929756 RepID=A0AA39JUJ8_ARMTA|nr:uncharacterized protein EV420DRAFT_790129 [Desarmillaria tabescens]KAK0449063.1 hypothetical protein EV420DRAFT_790129 [Desarmillaria tabescens]